MAKTLIMTCACGKPFEVTKCTKRYCSQRCKMRYYMREYRRRHGAHVRIKTKCARCGGPNVVTMQRLRAKFCAKCRAKTRSSVNGCKDSRVAA